MLAVMLAVLKGGQLLAVGCCPRAVLSAKQKLADRHSLARISRYAKIDGLGAMLASSAP